MTHTKTALVTGAARRIGRTITLRLAAAGYDVAIHHRGEACDAEALADEIRLSGRKAMTIRCDLADADAVLALVPTVCEGLGAPVCLVNNASVFEHDTALTMDPASWALHLDVNLRAPLLLARSFADHLPAHASGDIINLVDQRAYRPTPEFFSYTLSKTGLLTATQLLARALAPRIRVNAIGPGPVLQSVHQTPGEVRSRAGVDAARTRCLPRRDRRRAPVHSAGAVHDRGR